MHQAYLSEYNYQTFQDQANTLPDSDMLLLRAQTLFYLLYPYIREDFVKARWNYVVLDDVALGAAILGKTSLQMRYAKDLLSAEIRYAEDYMYRLMMFDGVSGSYFRSTTVFYEYGTGVSSGKSKAWKKKLFHEYILLGGLMAKRPDPDAFQTLCITGRTAHLAV